MFAFRVTRREFRPDPAEFVAAFAAGAVIYAPGGYRCVLGGLERELDARYQVRLADVAPAALGQCTADAADWLRGAMAESAAG